MPQKRNPVHATLTRACARLAAAHAAVLQETLVQEHERAAGAWHAEWEALSGALAFAGGAAAAVSESLAVLQVDEQRMRVNLDASGGLVLAERVAIALAERLGRGAAHAVVAAAAGAPVFREALRLHPPVPQDARRAVADVELEGRTVPGGTLVGIPLILLSRDPELYPDPDSYRPERWLGRKEALSPLEIAQFGVPYSF